jgi:uncharacterized membrane protein/sporulation protein YlmC with PRC-barrel domain
LVFHQSNWEEKMVNKIPLHAKVMCTDGLAGESTSVIVHPLTQKITSLIVQDKTLADPVEWVVPVEEVVACDSVLIQLTCTREKLSQMQPFRQAYYLEQEFPEYVYVYSYPYMVSMAQPMPTMMEELNISPEEIGIHRGTRVEAIDGYIGLVGELILSPESWRITHFTMMRGKLWGKKEICIPLVYVDHVEQDTVILNVRKQQIDDLPALPVKRPWKEVNATDLDILVWSFQGMDQAGEALKALKELEKTSQIQLLYIAAIMKESDGRISLRETKEIDSLRVTVTGAITGGLVGLLIGPGGAILGAAAGAAGGRRAAKKVELGISEDRLKAFQDQMEPNTSATLLMIEHRWFNTARQALAQFDAKFFHQRLTDLPEM